MSSQSIHRLPQMQHLDGAAAGWGCSCPATCRRHCALCTAERIARQTSCRALQERLQQRGGLGGSAVGWLGLAFSQHLREGQEKPEKWAGQLGCEEPRGRAITSASRPKHPTARLPWAGRRRKRPSGGTARQSAHPPGQRALLPGSARHRPLHGKWGGEGEGQGVDQEAYDSRPAPTQPSRGHVQARWQQQLRNPRSRSASPLSPEEGAASPSPRQGPRDSWRGAKPAA